MSLRLGIFGGTFDPIHLGHLILAELARYLLRLDQVLFVPARIPPHKGSTPTDAERRIRMTRLGTEGNPHFAVSDIELRREGPSYTVDTLRALRDQKPDTEHYLLMGADSARDLESWKDHQVLLEDSTVVVMARPGVDAMDLPPSLGGRTTVLSTPQFDISSSQIRGLVREGGPIRYLVTDSVEGFIRSEGLYRS
ncbi:MAG: putative nicotinate-nucleotide adenylyltransferase [Gemmatimonadota bacterium]|nr:MAG: putative nicotinate-nucleotide adenylyltransferase [Gemmatimonadota bacterium]